MERYSERSGVNQFLGRVYSWMFLGLLLSGAVATFILTPNPISSAFWRFVSQTRGMALYGIMILELILVVSFRVDYNNLRSSASYIAKFIVYAMLNGLTLSVIGVVYRIESIGMAFFSTCGIFGIMSAIGYFTKYDLSNLGKQLIAALLAAVVVSVFNFFFFKSNTASLIVSFVMLIIFIGLTAYDTQKAKRLYYAFGGAGDTTPIALLSALELYLDFVNIFILLLRLTGRRR